VDPAESNRDRTTRILAIAAIVIALTAPYWQGPVLGGLGLSPPAMRALAANRAALDRLDRQSAELEHGLGATTAELEQLRTGLATTTARATEALTRANALAVVELATALRRNGPFDLELATVRAASTDPAMTPLLDAVEPYAATGVPATARLRQDLARIGMRITWTERGYVPVAWVSRLLPWQRGAAAAPAQPDPAPKLLGQASAALDGGDLPGAVELVAQVGEPHQEAVSDWLEDARARVAADILVRRLNDRIVQKTK
jgi:hypothetical protein